ncbi:hypothetical protein Tco_0810810 [Tanacetum coccineum]
MLHDEAVEWQTNLMGRAKRLKSKKNQLLKENEVMAVLEGSEQTLILVKDGERITQLEKENATLKRELQECKDENKDLRQASRCHKAKNEIQKGKYIQSNDIYSEVDQNLLEGMDEEDSKSSVVMVGGSNINERFESKTRSKKSKNNVRRRGEIVNRQVKLSYMWTEEV